jgi:hypothetical protein
MVSVNLFGETTAHVKSRVLGGNDGTPRFIALDVGPLGVIFASPEQVRAVALVLTHAADEFDAAALSDLPVLEPVPEPAPITEYPF